MEQGLAEQAGSTPGTDLAFSGAVCQSVDLSWLGVWLSPRKVSQNGANSSLLFLVIISAIIIILFFCSNSLPLAVLDGFNQRD